MVIESKSDQRLPQDWDADGIRRLEGDYKQAERYFGADKHVHYLDGNDSFIGIYLRYFQLVKLHVKYVQLQ